MEKLENIIEPIDIGPVDIWKTYKIAYPEQIEEIKAQSSYAINLFVSDNIDTLTKQAHSFVSKYSRLAPCGYETEDLILQLYVDLPFMDFSSEEAFHSFLVNRVFPWAGYGGFQSRLGKAGSRSKPWQVALVQSMDDNGAYGDGDGISEDHTTVYGYTPSVADEYIEEEDRARVLSVEKLKDIVSKYLSPKELDYIVKRLNGETYTKALENSSRQGGYNLHRSAFDKLIINYTAILSALRENGCVALENAVFERLVPEEYEKAVCRREKLRENQIKKDAIKYKRRKQKSATEARAEQNTADTSAETA